MGCAMEKTEKNEKTKHIHSGKFAASQLFLRHSSQNSRLQPK
jgi:hypothetical protein